MNANLVVISKILFWFGLPLLLLSGFYCYVYNSIVFNNFGFIAGILFCTPMFFIWSEASQKKAREKYTKELSQLTRQELEELGQKLFRLSGKYGALEKEVYKKVYRDRFGVEH